MWKIWKHDEPKYWTNLADYMAGQAPTLNPVIESAFDAALYAMGKNPYDAFRGKYALPEQLFKARDKRTHKAFMKYLANQLGASIIYRFQTDDLDRIKTDLEKDLQYPIVSNILGRFLKVSDQGERQAYRADKDLIDMTQAREILDAKEVIIKMVNGEPVSHEDIMKLAKRPSVVDRNLLVQMSRRYGYVFLDEYLTATTREAQFAVIKRWYDRYRLENPGEDITWIWGVPEVVMKSPPPRKESVESTKEPSAKKSLEEYSSQYYKRRRPGVSRQQQQANPFLGGTQ